MTSLFWPLVFLLFPFSLLARPEYAVKHSQVSCTVCHASPVGGGIRTTNGKLYGMKGHPPFSPWSMKDFFQMDTRFYALVPEDPTQTSHGLNAMTFLGSVNLPLEKDIHFVGSYGFGGWASGEREFFVKWRVKDEGLLEHVVWGKTQLPFGLPTDEHRTFTRLQTMTTINNFRKGILLSGRLTPRTHYDAMIINEYGTPTSSSIFWGGDVNLRWAPAAWPFFLGTSYLYFSRNDGASDPYAQSFYAAIFLDDMTRDLIDGALLLEWVDANHFNEVSGVGGHITEETAFVDLLKESRSEGHYVQFTWDLTPTFTLMYKYDFLALDRNYAGDAFTRQGVGFRYTPVGHMNFIFRAEFSKAGSQAIPSTDKANQSTYYLISHIWF
ncbi:MAG: hypothetical protein D6797_07115 [Bdellovibrio sp.]|nr:MAG: hypothetical protein D6797_07115 [Bdellovibrio sp.]